MNRNVSNCENSPKKSFSGRQRDSNPWPLRSRCSAFSVNWPALSVWVFIAQLGEHCSANAEATGSNPVEAPKNFFSGYFRNCLNCDSLRWSHTHFICIPAVHIISFCGTETVSCHLLLLMVEDGNGLRLENMRRKHWANFFQF